MPGDSSRNSDAFVQLMTEHQGRLSTGAIRCEVGPQRLDRPLVFQSPHAELTVLGPALPERD
jgi:hypothetical protein